MKNVMLELTRITQQAALAESPTAQVRTIVDEISSALHVDVCSLYLQNMELGMALVASHGLATQHPVVIPNGMGLVGLVAQSRHTVNLSEPEQHPDYYYVPKSKEERFHSFCGVPLVKRGEVIGVLVVQSRKAERLAQEQEAFLATLAAHLALLVPALPEQKCLQSMSSRRYEGIIGAAGIAIGEVKLTQSPRLMKVSDSKNFDTKKELASWAALQAKVITDLQRERKVVKSSLGENLAAVLDAHQKLLTDPGFEKKIVDEITAGHSLLTALKHTVFYFSELFSNLDDPYLRARHEDIDQLGDKLYQFVLNGTGKPLQTKIKSPVVLVGSQISISDIVSLPTDKLTAIVCFSGAALSHIAVFANALGIPAVMGVGELYGLRDGERMIVDGNSGQVILNPNKALLREYQQLIKSHLHFEQRLMALNDLPATTTDGVKMELLANAGLQADLMPGIRYGASGIGLYRTEIPFMIRESLPSEDDQITVYQQVFRAYSGKPIYIRTLDIGGDKPLPYLPASNEENPALGWRGIRFTLDNLQLLMTQLRAIVRAAEGKDNIHILLPMVSATTELDQCIKLLDDACQQLLYEGFAIQRPKVGIMVEVPAATSLLPFWQDKLDFISIGSNDLSQYLLAVDRNNPLVGKLYDPLHPAVIHELKRIILTAKACGLPVSLCGEMASDPIAVLLLMGLGIRRISMSSAKLPLIKWVVRSIPITAAEQLTQHVLTLDNAAAIRNAGQAMLAKLSLDFDGIDRKKDSH